MTIEIQLTNHMPEITSAIESAIQQAITTAAMLVSTEVKHVLSGTRSGRRYKIPGARGEYTASAPNEPPAVRLGNLRQSYDFMTEGRGAETIGIVGSPLKYSVYLEKGTSRMAPRPHLSIAFVNKTNEVAELFRDMV